MKKVLRFILVVTSLLMVLVSLGCGAKKDEVIQAKADTVIDDYIHDLGTAENKYKNKKVEFTGKVISKDQFTDSIDYYVVIGKKYFSGRMYSVSLVYKAKDVSKVNAIKVGDLISASGVCVGEIKQEDPAKIPVYVNVETDSYGQVAPAPEPVKKPEQVKVSPTPVSKISYKDFGFKSSGRGFTLADNMDTVISAFGQPSYTKNVSSRVEDGVRYEGGILYVYGTQQNGLTVFKGDTKGLVYAIVRGNPSYYTTKGITIGSTRQDVIDAYGTSTSGIYDYRPSTRAIDYGDWMRFDFADGRVTRITIGDEEIPFRIQK